jgi:hypothetical protein
MSQIFFRNKTFLFVVRMSWKKKYLTNAWCVCRVSFQLIRRLNQKLFFSDNNTGKTLPKNCWNLSTSLKCFACIYYHWKKFFVQSVYLKRRTLISLHIAHTLKEWICSRTTDTQRELFFIKSQTFGLGLTFWAELELGPFSVKLYIITHLGTVRSLSIIQPLFLQKISLYIQLPNNSQIFIWEWDLNFGSKEFEI